MFSEIDEDSIRILANSLVRDRLPAPPISKPVPESVTNAFLMAFDYACDLRKFEAPTIEMLKDMHHFNCLSMYEVSNKGLRKHDRDSTQAILERDFENPAIVSKYRNCFMGFVRELRATITGKDATQDKMIHSILKALLSVLPTNMADIKPHERRYTERLVGYMDRLASMTDEQQEEYYKQYSPERRLQIQVEYLQDRDKACLQLPKFIGLYKAWVQGELKCKPSDFERHSFHTTPSGLPPYFKLPGRVCGVLKDRNGDVVRPTTLLA